VEDYRAAMLQSLIAVAWADQRLHAREVEVLDALIAAFGASGEEAEALRDYAKTPRTLDDVPLSELCADDRRLLVQHAVLLSYADGDPAQPELRVIDDLVTRLRIPQEEAAPLLAAAHGRARKLSSLHRSDAAPGASPREQA
jgi:uncharacterized tellurite resistance protein B-like protein